MAKEPNIEEFYQISLQGEAFAQSLTVGETFLGARGHCPYEISSTSGRMWRMGFLDELPEKVCTTPDGTITIYE